MTPRLGDKIVWVNQFTDPGDVRTGTITRLNNEYAWTDNQHKPEDCILLAYIFPAVLTDELLEILTTRMRLKKAFDDSMGLVYKLRNKATLLERAEDLPS